MFSRATARVHSVHAMNTETLPGGELLLAERCRTDDLMPSISLLCLPPCRVNPEILLKFR